MPGKRGNQNALKHGLYAKRFTPDEKKRLDRIPSDDVTGELELLRTVADRIMAHLSRIEGEEKLKMVNTLTLVTGSISTLVRTQHLVKGTSSEVETSILEALQMIREDMGIQ